MSKILDSDCYWGPVEDLQAGDIIHWKRLEEVRGFVRKRGGNTGIPVGINDQWRDGGQRPFRQMTPEKYVARPKYTMKMWENAQRTAQREAAAAVVSSPPPAEPNPFDEPARGEITSSPSHG